MVKKESIEFAGLKIHAELSKAIDEHVEKSKDTLGMKKYSSRADFVEQACKHLLEQDQKRAKPVLIG